MVKTMQLPNKLQSKRRYLKWYLTGFVDAEGCFSVAIKQQDSAKFGWVVDPLFQITQHKKDKELLEIFKKTLNCGRVIKKPGNNDLWLLLVDNRRQLAEKVIPFFEDYPLITKQEDFKHFKKIVTGLENKEHSKRQGIRKLIRQAYKMNLAGKQRRRDLNEILDSF